MPKGSVYDPNGQFGLLPDAMPLYGSTVAQGIR
jgi:hypothetical protein